MKILILYVETQKEEWSQRALSVYLEKLKRFCDIEIVPVKSPSLSRENKDQKIKQEAKLIFSKIKKEDQVVLFDEKGRSMDSPTFAEFLKKSPSTKRLVFLVGGAFGVSDEVKAAVDQKISLSTLVMNHHVAMAVVMEQIYRGFTIIKKIPYHNN